MAFVNEEIKSPEEIAEFDSFGLISPVTRKPAERWKWTVDRERGMYFFSLGGGFSEIPYFFALAINGDLIYLEGTRDGGGEYSKKNIEITWHISSIKIPNSLSLRAGELMRFSQEALVAYGAYFDNEGVMSVHVDLPSPTFI